MSVVVRAYRRHPAHGRKPLPQTDVASWLDITQRRSHTHLLYVSARFAEFTGWLHQDAGDLRAAAQWSNTALDLAREAGDTAPGAVSAASDISVLRVGAGGRFHRVTPRLRDGDVRGTQ